MAGLKRRAPEAVTQATATLPATMAVTDLFARAVEAHRQNHLTEAEQLYRDILACDPHHAESWSNLGFALLSRQACGEAAEACRRAITVRPDFADGHFNLIAALEAGGREEDAVPIYDRVIALRPDRVDLCVKLAGLHERAGRLGRALDAHRRAVVLAPGDAAQHFNLGRMLAMTGSTEAAVAAYRDALAIDPALVPALSALGSILVSLGRHDEAAEAGRRAQDLLPDDANVANNCAVVLQQGGRTAEAADMYRRALAADPHHAGAWANLGVALQELFRFDDAVEAFEKAIAAKPDFHSAIVEAIKIRRHICDWSRYDQDRDRLLDLIDKESDAVFMLLLMSFSSTPEQQYTCARRHMARINADTSRITPSRPAPSGRLRIGYLSTDYRDHPVGRLLPELLAQHDRSTVEVFGYALGRDDPGRVRRRIVRACDHFVDLHAMSNRDAAERIRNDGIDILIDLTGPTTGARLDILNLRPAPVQVSFLGWPGTTGLDCIDYVVGDGFLTSGDQQPCYSERIVQLPRCYQPSDPYRATTVPALSRADCGLPDDGFVFCSFNNTVKLTPDMFDLWMRLLARVEGSVLWLYCKTPQTMANLRARAELRGVDAKRIVFAPVGPMDLYLGRLRLADLFLDSYPYNAGATCNDALWMGLPVLTLTGETYVSRMAGSLLRAAGLPELITRSAEDYETEALRLATEPAVLADLKARLMRHRDTSPLFDMPGFAASLERAFVHMRFRAASGLPAEGFAITDAAL